MYSVQDERLDPLKGKSSSVYIVESDNDFFWCVIQANKQFSQSVFFSLLLLLCRCLCLCETVFIMALYKRHIKFTERMHCLNNQNINPEINV